MKSEVKSQLMEIIQRYYDGDVKLFLLDMLSDDVFKALLLYSVFEELAEQVRLQ